MRPNRFDYADVVAFCLVLCTGVITIWQATARQLTNVNTETDFIGAFQPEAARFMSGQPMEILFHPPGYPISLATVYSIVNDWFTAGLVISVFCAITVLVASYLCFRELVGPFAGLGALVALLGSAVFWSFSIQSTSDIHFLAIWCLTLYTAIIAMRRQVPWQWLALGVLISIGVLSRTNGIVLMLLMFAPFLTDRPVSTRFKNALIVVLATAAPILSWLLYSSIIGSPFMPTKTFANLALTYFSSERISGDARIMLESQFTSSWQVLMADPMQVFQIYIRDLIRLPVNLLVRVTWKPLALLCFICSLAWIYKVKDIRIFTLITVTLAMTALTNMKAFEARYYLYMLPIGGASIGLALIKLSEMRPHWIKKPSIQNSSLLVLAILAFYVSGFSGFERAENRVLSAQFVEMASEIQNKTPDNSIIMCRKCNGAYHSQRSTIFFPQIDTIEDLCRELQASYSSFPIFIAIGESEKIMRMELSKELMSQPLPEWLELTAEGKGNNPWKLIRYKHEASCN